MTVDVTPSTERSRRWRRRQREHLLLARAEVPAQLIEHLIASKVLTDDQAHDPEAIGHALVELATRRVTIRA